MKEYIEGFVLRKHEDQGYVLIDPLSASVFQDWDRIDKITYSPKIGKKVLEMDLSAVSLTSIRKYHPENYAWWDMVSTKDFSSDDKTQRLGNQFSRMPM